MYALIRSGIIICPFLWNGMKKHLFLKHRSIFTSNLHQFDKLQNKSRTKEKNTKIQSIELCFGSANNQCLRYARFYARSWVSRDEPQGEDNTGQYICAMG